MSRELFRELLSAEGPSAVSAFQAFMHTSIALGERRAGVVSTMSRAAHGAFAVGRLRSTALELYVGALKRPAQPLEHFDAVLALASLALQQPDLATVARLAVEEWAGRATSKSGFRKELGLSFAMVLDDPGLARERALAWCRDVLRLRGGGEAQTATAMPQRCGVPEK